MPGKSRRLVWSERGRGDLRRIVAYIAERNPPAAAKVADRIDQTVRNLASMPTGRRGRVLGTFEKPLPGLPYIIAYAIERGPPREEVVVILRIIHGARDWPQGRWPE